MTKEELAAQNQRAWDLRKTEPERGRELASKLCDEAWLQDDKEELARAYCTLGACELALGNRHSAMGALEEAAELRSGGSGLEAEIHLLLLRCSFLNQQYEAALRYGHLGLAPARESGDVELAARALNDIGLVYAQMGAYQQALEHLLASLKALEAAGGSPAGGPLNNIGNIYLLQEDPEAALGFFDRALAAFRESGATRDEVTALGNIGRAREALGQWEEALGSCEESVRLARGLEDPTYLATALSKLGAVLTKRGEAERARACLDEALAVYARQPEPGAFMEETILALAELHISVGDFESALPLYAGQLENAQGAEDRALRRSVLDGMSRALEGAGRWREALERFRQYHELSSELDRELYSSQTRALLLQHDVELARREQELLRGKNQELEAAYGELKELHGALEAQAEELRRLSLEDPLTGLFNRRWLERRAAEELALVKRYGGSFGVMMGDIDGFKHINDRHSHAVGDEILARVGAIIRRQAREVDVATRMGGDEFVVLFPETGLRAAAAAAEKVRRAVQSYPWQDVDPELQVTMSIGVADSAAGGDFEAILLEADAQLYRAKNEGKNRVCSAGGVGAPETT